LRERVGVRATLVRPSLVSARRNASLRSALTLPSPAKRERGKARASDSFPLPLARLPSPARACFPLSRLRERVGVRATLVRPSLVSARRNASLRSALTLPSPAKREREKGERFRFVPAPARASSPLPQSGRGKSRSFPFVRTRTPRVALSAPRAQNASTLANPRSFPPRAHSVFRCPNPPILRRPSARF
jgi:hypothetical protein